MLENSSSAESIANNGYHYIQRKNYYPNKKYGGGYFHGPYKLIKCLIFKHQDSANIMLNKQMYIVGVYFYA